MQDDKENNYSGSDCDMEDKKNPKNLNGFYNNKS
jgi:hypothetical protein